MEISVNTEEVEESVKHSSAKKSIIKTVKDTGCQYDTKDLGAGRPSLKRVSIAAAPIIH